jgi:hypothetical protein
MKTTFLTKLTASLLLACSITFIACEKDKSESSITPQEEEQAIYSSSESEAETEAISNDVFDDVMGVSDDVGMAGTGIFGGRLINGRIDSTPHCVKVTYTELQAPAHFPLKVVIDFGNGCQGRDGRTRYGKIITVYTGRLIIPGKSAITEFEGYRIDSISVQGRHVITNTSSSTNRQFTIDVSGKLTRPSGNYVQWAAHRVITQVEGLATPLFPHDDVFTITGQANGTVKRHSFVTEWESNIVEPLVKRFDCRWISKGIVRTIRKNQTSSSPWIGVLNYGNGDCDKKAVLTINGIHHQISLH